ncbi:MAG: ABC transporter ATP-binding protein [Planctomycetes bacterium]|nr:ABC transporter ATP-binding protein [Planctomycetota bacterium]
MIYVEDLCKSFGEHLVLDHITCHVERDKTTVFVGQSGVGKSVLMKHMVGLLYPDEGKVVVDGKDLAELSEAELYELRKKFGMLFQDGALFDSMTVADNVAFPLRHHTEKREAEIAEIVAEKLRQVGMPGTEEMMPSELSGGMRKRVGLARALALDPEIVFFDEPTTGLDPVIAATVDNLISETQEQLGITFVVISHDIPSTFSIAHNVGVLYGGKLIEYGPRDEIQGSANPILRQFFARKAEGPIKVV